MSRRVLWSPSQSHQFATCSPNDLRLFDYDVSSRGAKTSNVVSDLPTVKTFAWAPDSSSQTNLFAVGTASGRTILLSLSDAFSAAPLTYTFSTRHARPVNSLAFASTAPLLACGLDKARENGLLVYDMTSAENKPVAQFGMSEGVTSLAFSKVATRSPLLLAAMGGKALRAYDFRTPPASASAWSHEISPMEQPGISVTQSSIMSTKATLGVQANPHDENTFVSFGDDGFVRLWDMRRASEPVLFFSESEATDHGRSSPILTCLFSPAVPNLLLTQGASPNDVPRFWNMSCFQTPNERAHWALLGRKEGEKSSRPPASVAFVNLPKTDCQTSIISISKEGLPEFSNAPERHSLAWSSHNDLTALTTQLRVFGPKPSTSILPTTTMAAPESPTPKQKLDMEDDEGNTLNRDIASTMQSRLRSGYSVNATTNANLTDGALQQGWKRLEHMAELAGEEELGFVGRFDLAFVGVKNVFEPIAPILKGSSRKLHHAQQEEELQEAMGTIAERCGWQSSSIRVSTTLRTQRLFALGLCGSDFARDDVEGVVQRKEEAGEVEAAAAHALFSGDSDRAIRALMNSDDDRLRLLAPSLARQTAMAASHTPASSQASFRDLCASLSSELDSPHLRAIFAYLGTGDWEEVVFESGLPLAERVAVALRYLSDKTLRTFLERNTDACIASGNLEGLVLTGLTESGLALLQNYVDRSGDVQSAAIAASFVFPARLDDARAQRWVESYRDLLDSWECYMERATFDIERGSIMRSTASRLKAAGRKDTTVAQFQPARLFVRCSFCNTTVSSATSGLNNTKRKGNATTCPTCHKSFPKCAICLEAFSIPEVSATTMSPAWAWCATCRHGGHHAHLLEWFNGHEECPVASCHCKACRPRQPASPSV